jgi:small conductance mechanosensitive channel
VFVTPFNSVASLLAQQESVEAVCGPPEERSWLCETVHSMWGRPGLARAADVLVAKPVAVAFILVLAFILNRLARRAIRRLVRRLEGGLPASRWQALTAGAAGETSTVAAARSAQRAVAIGTLLRSIVSLAIWIVAALMALGELGLNVGPLLAGAGVVGIALGFGAQALVKDFLSGIFMLVEDQFGVGDVIDVGDASGTVESVSLRSTRLRSVDGVVWHVPNGEIRRVGNQSQQWSRALIDVPVPYSADVSNASTLIQQVADDLAAEPEWSDRILSRPEVWGVERFDADSVAVRTVLQTVPLEQWKVARELRRRLKYAFDDAGLEIPFPQRTVWVRHDDTVDVHLDDGRPGDDRGRYIKHSSG